MLFEEQMNREGTRAASRLHVVYNDSCLRNASLITLIGLISELAAGKCQSGQWKMERLINGKGDWLQKPSSIEDTYGGYSTSLALLERVHCKTLYRKLRAQTLIRQNA